MAEENQLTWWLLEPFTQVWSTIRATVGSGQAVLLTSHSMAEVTILSWHFSPIADPHISPLTYISPHWLFAFVILFVNKVDTLCDRLAILVSGRINAEGSPDRLKQQFGGGYKVSLRLKKSTILKSLYMKVSLRLNNMS